MIWYWMNPTCFRIYLFQALAVNLDLTLYQFLQNECEKHGLIRRCWAFSGNMAFRAQRIIARSMTIWNRKLISDMHTDHAPIVTLRGSHQPLSPCRPVKQCPSIEPTTYRDALEYISALHCRQRVAEKVCEPWLQMNCARHPKGQGQCQFVDVSHLSKKALPEIKIISDRCIFLVKQQLWRCTLQTKTSRKCRKPLRSSFKLMGNSDNITNPFSFQGIEIDGEKIIILGNGTGCTATMVQNIVTRIIKQDPTRHLS